MEHEEELGAPTRADGTELSPEQAKAELENTTRIVEFVHGGVTYKAKIDLLKLRRFHDRIYGLAQYDALKLAGFSEEEAKNLKDLGDDPRFEKLLDIQGDSRKIARAEATIAADLFVAWNVPAPAPTVEDLLGKGGVYDAYTEAVTAGYGPTARRSVEGAATA